MVFVFMVISSFHVSCFLFSFQAYTEVPSTPLHTAAVLREEEENWQDVKVRDSVVRQGLSGQIKRAALFKQN